MYICRYDLAQFAMTVFVNGQIVNSASGKLPFIGEATLKDGFESVNVCTGSNTTLSIGTWGAGCPTCFFYGRLTDVRLYTAALPDIDVYAIFSTSMSVVYSPNLIFLASTDACNAGYGPNGGGCRNYANVSDSNPHDGAFACNCIGASVL